jgi:hypothetical protein
MTRKETLYSWILSLVASYNLLIAIYKPHRGLPVLVTSLLILDCSWLLFEDEVRF